MVHVSLVDVCVFQFDGVGEEAAEAAAPLDDARNCDSKHEVIGFDVLCFSSKLLEVLEMPRSLPPWQCLAELPSWSFMIQ